MNKLSNTYGFSLIELIVVIIVIGIMTSIAMQSMNVVIDNARIGKTRQEMEMLSNAIVGNPELTSNGYRSDFGYVGDIGAVPPDLQALYQNPGLGTWNGPYIKSGFTQDLDGFKIDEWGSEYSYTGGITITSTGSGSNIIKKFADATSDYLLNSLNGTIKDIDDSIPGATYVDSIQINITIPNGIGGTSTKIYTPDLAGNFTLDSLPAGLHSLDIIYKPVVDTLHRYVTILPRHKSSVAYNFASNYFSSGGGGGSGSEILRPNGSGSSTQLIDIGCSVNWQCVDEATSDDGSTSVIRIGSSWKTDLYSVENHTTGTGIIDSIVVYINCWGWGGEAKTKIRTNNTNYEGNSITLTGTYTTYSTTYIVNPNTSSAWTWTEVDALEAGVAIRNLGSCTQAWVEVFYTY